MNRRQRETLRKIFREPPPSNLKWIDIEDLLKELVEELGGDIRKGNGARTRVKLNGVAGDRDPRIGVFLPPYSPYASIGLIRDVRSFLREVGI